MQKRVLCLLAALIAGACWVNAAVAKVWLLPDYQAKQLYSNRANSPDQGNGGGSTGGISCSDYSGLIASEPAGQSCQVSWVGNLKCFIESTCACTGDYAYTDATCSVSDGKIPGEACTDSSGTHYKSCRCDPSKYTTTKASCSTEVSGDSCTVDGVTYYETCIEDPCAGKEIVSCGKALGCAETCDADGTQCIRCNEQPDCGDGKYWAGDDLGCVINTCPVDYAANTADCGLTVSNSHWELGSEANGRSGTNPCYACTLRCDAYYADYDEYWCDQKPQTIDCESLGYKKENTSGGLISVECANGATKLRCPFDDSYYICAGEKQVISSEIPDPDPEPTTVCSDFNSGVTEYLADCSDASDSVCMSSSYQDSDGNICKFRTLCADDSDCNKYLSVALPANINSETDINDYGNQYCYQQYGENDLLLWADPKCSDPATLCVRCDTSKLCDSSYTLSSCPTGANCSSCGGKFKVEGCYGCYIKSGSACSYHKGMTEAQMCSYIAYNYSSSFNCSKAFQSQSDIDQCGSVLAEIMSNMGDESEGGETDMSVICDMMCPSSGSCSGNPCP